MSRILFTVWPFAGHFNPCMSVALQLQALGHEVAFYTGDRMAPPLEHEQMLLFPFQKLAEALSARVCPGEDEDLYDVVAKHYTSIGESPMARMRRIQAFFREVLAGTIREQLEDLRVITDRWRPDMLVSDAMMWGTFTLAGEVLQLPVAVFSFYAGCLIPAPGSPPLGLGLPWADGLFSRLKNAVAARVSGWLTANIRAMVNNLRSEYGQPPLGMSILRYASKMPLYLVSSVPQFDYNRSDLPSSVHYVGPCLWDRIHSDASLPWLKDLPPDRPLIYVSEGTAQFREPFLLRAAICGLAELPVDVVVTTGPGRIPDLGALPPNVRVEQWVAHSSLFPRVSIVITNGGSGTVREALRWGIPLLVAPMEWDQLENAQRVSHSGVGIRLGEGQCTPENLRDKTKTLLDEPGYRRRAQAMKSIFASYGQERQAAFLIERLASAASTTSNVGGTFQR